MITCCETKVYYIQHRFLLEGNVWTDWQDHKDTEFVQLHTVKPGQSVVDLAAASIESVAGNEELRCIEQSAREVARLELKKPQIPVPTVQQNNAIGSQSVY